MPEPLRIVIADDHPIFRGGLRQVLAGRDSLRVVEEAEDGEQALRAIERARPDIAVIDIDMPKKSGFDVITALRTAGSDLPVVFLTMYNDREMFDRALDLGARGYVLKESAVREIIEAIQLVAAGKYYVSPSLTSFLVDRSNRSAAFQNTYPGLASLTPTERKILGLIAQGLTSKEISAMLNVSARTVDTHRLNIAAKLDLRGTHQLVKFALQNRSYL